MTNPPTLRALGLCGADDSVHPNMLILLSTAYPFIEFGVLFRPDKEGPTTVCVTRMGITLGPMQNRLV
jgi:hypothetical protein